MRGASYLMRGATLGCCGGPYQAKRETWGPGPNVVVKKPSAGPFCRNCSQETFAFGGPRWVPLRPVVSRERHTRCVPCHHTNPGEKKRGGYRVCERRSTPAKIAL